MTARETAVRALLRQEQSGYANLILAAALKKEKLSVQDIAFTSALFYGTVERQLTLDFILNQFSKKPMEKLDPPVRAVLRSGLYQLCYMQVPPSAAVNEAVKLTKKLGKTSAAGMVNAVLRRSAAFDLEQAAFSGTEERLSVLYSVDRSVVRCLVQAYGEAETQAILTASFERPPLSVRVNRLKTDTAGLLEQLAQEHVLAAPGEFPDGLILSGHGDPSSLRAFRQGLFYVQGTASQWAALCTQAQPGQTVLDLCAAPGGKTLTLAGMMQGRGVLYSCDVSPNRTSLIRAAAERCGAERVKILQNDASRFNPAFLNMDCVLCDVPCSGLGTLAKKPDIRYKQMDDMESLYALQHEIFKMAGRYVKPGGRLVYSTCTLNPKENERQVEQFLAENPSFALAAPPRCPAGATPGRWGTTLFPHKTKTDGFFAAVLQRKQENP